jgi:chaperone BCS1
MMGPGLFNQITTTVLHGQNQFASGGLLLMVIGGIAAYFKGIPVATKNFLMRQFTISLTITDDHSAFEWVQWWFQNREYAKRMRNVDAFTPYMGGKFKAEFKPAPGTHWFFYRKRPLFINFIRADEKKGYTTKRDERYIIWTWGRDQSFLKNILKEIYEDYGKAYEHSPTLQCWGGGSWIKASAYSPRPLNSVILPSGVKNQLIVDIDRFKSSEKWYEQMGVPYHRGYLLHGPPGTGKTSLVSGLSSHYNSTVFILKLNEMSDSLLQEAVRDAGSNSMIVLEDIDCAVDTVIQQRKQEKKGGDEVPEKSSDKNRGLTLSGLLNVLDGMQTPRGAQFFMTTNHIDKLDAALLRPGRTDVKVFLGAATDWQKAQLYMRFFPEHDGLAAINFVMSKPQAVSMADFQEELMQVRTKDTDGSMSTAAGA